MDLDKTYVRAKQILEQNIPFWEIEGEFITPVMAIQALNSGDVSLIRKIKHQSVKALSGDVSPELLVARLQTRNAEGRVFTIYMLRNDKQEFTPEEQIQEAIAGTQVGMEIRNMELGLLRWCLE